MKPKNQTLSSKIALALLACSAALTARGDYPSTVISQGPVAYYRLGETIAPPPPVTATNLGSLGDSFDGTYNNDPLRGLPGPLTGGDGAAVNFDGISQSVQTTYDPALNPSSFTIEAWLNPASATVNGGLLCALASMHSGTPRSGWLLYQTDVNGVGNGWVIRLYNQNGASVSIGGSAGLLAATNLTAGTWYDVVFTYDNNTRLGSIYVNGQLLNSATAVGFVPNPDAVFSIGVRSDNGFYWPGKASEVSYYASALSATQVLAHYTAAAVGATYPSVILADSPIAYYRLNEPGDPVASNLGTLGTAADATYIYNALPGQPGPQAPAFPGFDASNLGAGFDGNSGYVKIPPLNLNTNTVTMTAWVNLNGVNNPNAGIIYSDSGATQAGLKIDVANANGLSYNWSSDVAANFNSGLFIPSSPQWAFVALMTTSNYAVLAIQDGTSFQFVTNFITLGPLPFAGPTLIGSDAGSAALTLNGTVDEVAIFNRTLALGEVYTEYAAGAGTNPPIVFQDPLAPVDQLFTGDTLSLTVDAGGTPPLFYQWKKGSTAISGATTSAFTIPSLTNSDAATYSVVVSNALGSATSAGAVIAVNNLSAPSITTPPVGRTLYPGGTLDLTVVATGGGLSYQWSQNGTPVDGATDSAYLVPSVTTSNAGTYVVFISNHISTATSVGVAVTVLAPASGTFESTIVADKPEAWWRLNDASGSGTMADAVGRHDGTYIGGVTLGSPGLPLGTSTSATFDGSSGYASVPYSTVLNSEIFTVEAWVHTSDLIDEMGVFSSFSTGSGSPYKGKGEFVQRTAAAIFSGGIGLNDQYSYYYVNMGPNIADKWTQIVVTYGGSGGLSYWQDGVLSAGGYGDFVRNATSPFLIGTVYPTIDDWWWNGEIADVIYYTTNLSADQINAHYQAALYGTTSKPVITVQPTDQTVVAGNSLTLSAHAEGSTPLSVQWLKGGTPVAGATNETLTIATAFFTDAGNYQLTASNSIGTTNSSIATVTVLAVPQFVNATNGLVLHLGFDGAYTDSSGHGNDGTAVGAPDFVPGKIGSNALHYSTFTDGGVSGNAVTNANYVTLGTPADLQFGADTNFSVSFWIKVPSNSLSGDLPYFGNTPNSFGGNGYDLAPSYKTGGWSWSFSGAVSATGAGGSINNGKWHNLVYTFDRTGNAVTYLDGVAVDTTADSAGGDLDNGQPTNIGQDPSGAYPEQGEADIDDLGVWTRVLSSYEAYSIYYVGQNYSRSFDTYGPVQVSLVPVTGGFGVVYQAGTLQSATSLSGPWTTVTGAAPPFYQFSATSGTLFYRVKL